MAKIQFTETVMESAPTECAPLREKIIYALRNVFDPELPVNVYDLGLVYGLDLTPAGKQQDVAITYTLTAPNCPVAQQIPADMMAAVRKVNGVNEVTATLTFTPPWHKSMMSEAAQLELGYI